MVVFNKMARFGAIEIFSVGPFVMSGIDSGWPEKLVHFFFRAIAELGMESKDQARTRRDFNHEGASNACRLFGNWGTDGQREGTGNR